MKINEAIASDRDIVCVCVRVCARACVCVLRIFAKLRKAPTGLFMYVRPSV